MERTVRSDVSVIVSAYAQPDTLELVLYGLSRQTVLPQEVVIADDGSSPPLAEAIAPLVESLPFTVKHVWQPDEGFRAARSRNNAIEVAAGPLLAFLDQDTVPHADWLATHLEYAGKGRVCLARIVALDEQRSTLVTVDTIASGEFENWIDPHQLAKLRRQQTKYCGYALMRRLRLPFKRTRPSLSSGNICAWRDDLVPVNGFDEAYVGWGQEDDDLGRRLWAAGVTPVPILTKAMVSHICHPERHGDWRKGGNLERYRRRLTSTVCDRGLADHPHHDVVVTQW